MQSPHSRTPLAWAISFILTFPTRVEQRFEGRQKERGATAVEYGLLVGLIAIVIIVGVSALGGRLQQIFANLATALGG